MSLFVPILRLLMLFLNVYDSYKTLKPPPPSTRNPSRPSVRGMAQRKRDIKGCLAVWIVWAALALYERMVEDFMSFFIPFYGELKSLVLLFLIVTRARGAEPIYLHLIRPTIKPYTKTLDALLEIIFVVSDFLIALSTYPARLAMQWWTKRFKQTYAYATSDVSSSDSSNELNPSQVSSSFFASSGNPAIPDRVIQDLNASSERSIDRENRFPSLSQSTHHERRSRTQEHLRPQHSPFGSDPLLRRPSSSHKDSQNQAIDVPSSRYQVWYPPTAKRADEEGGADRPLRPLALAVNVTEEVSVVQQQVDEWRQYPAFPSAYPPTPIATTSKILPTAFSTSPSRFPTIEEEPCRQGFWKSLLPPRGPLNPSRACDWSDKTTFGISSSQLSNAHDADDSLSTDDYDNEDEDDFNTTLKTPLQPQGSAKSRPQLRLFVSPRSISISSVPSQSSALTTVDNGSPLRTTTSSEPSPSGLPFKPLPSSIGKKRSFPHSQLLSSRNRVREVEEDSLDQDSSDMQPATKEKFPRLSQGSTSDSSKLQSTVGVDSTSISGGSNTNDQDQIPPEEKRRRVVRSPSARAIKPRRRLGKTSSNYSPPTRARSSGTAAQSRRHQLEARKRVEGSVVAPKRRSGRSKAVGVGAPPAEPDDQTSASISEVDNDAPIKMTLRNRSKR